MQNQNSNRKNDFIYGRNAVTEALLKTPSRINKILISKNVTNDTKINEIIDLYIPVCP